MSDNRFERDVLLKFIKDEVLEFTSKIHTLNESLTQTTELMKTSLQVSGSTLASQVTVSMDELGRRIKGIQEVVDRGQVLLKDETEIFKKQLEIAAEQSREGAKLVLKMGAYDMAKEAVSQGIKEQIVPHFTAFLATTKQTVDLANKAIEGLQNAGTQARKDRNQISWVQVGVLVSVVMTSTLFTNVGLRFLDDNWPWKFSSTELVYLNNGKFMEQLWPTLDAATQKIYVDRVGKLSGGENDSD